MRLAIRIERLTPWLAPFVVALLVGGGAMLATAHLWPQLVLFGGWAAAAAVILSAICKRATRANRKAVEAILARVEAGEASPASALFAAD